MHLKNFNQKQFYKFFHRITESSYGWFRKYLFVLLAISLYVLLLFFLNSARSDHSPNNFSYEIFGEYEVINYAKFDNTKISFKVRGIRNNQNIYLIRTENSRENYFDVGDKIFIHGKVQEINFKNDYFYSQHIKGIFNTPEIVLSKKGSGLLAELSKFHFAILSEININYHGQVADLLAGLLIGANIEFSEDLEDSFKTTNTSHIIAVSGFNLNLLAEFLSLLLVILPRKKLSIIIFFILLVFYCIVGFDNVPCLRALLMQGIRSFALLLGKRSSYLNIWGMSLFIILILDPFLVFSTSLKLSFLATLGLILLESIYSKLNIVIENWIISNAMVSFFCSIGILPISLYLGSSITLKGIIANVLVVPIIPLVMVSGFISVIFSVVKMPLLIIVVRFTDALLQLLLLIIDISSKL